MRRILGVMVMRVALMTEKGKTVAWVLKNGTILVGLTSPP